MISLLHPSRGRPEKAAQTAKDWIEKAGCDVEYILSIDSSDQMKSFYIHQFSSNWILNAINPIKTFIEFDNKSVVEATNKAAKIATGDILLYLSDDFKCFDNWGVVVENEFKKYTGPTLIKVDDCLQKFSTPVLTIPIMNRELYNKLGYFWFPEYKSMWVDCDLYETVKRIGALKLAEHLKFPHEHHSIGKTENDETYKRSEANWNQGLEIFNKRKKQNFPI